MVRALRKELGTEHGTIQWVANQLGYGVESVRSWVRQANVDDGYAPGLSTAENHRTIGQGRITALSLPAQPFEHRRARSTQLLGHLCGRPTSSDTLDDEAASEPPPGECETHPLRQEVLPISSRHAVDNLPGHDT